MAYMKDRMIEVGDLSRLLQSEFPKETGGFFNFLQQAEGGVNLQAKDKEMINVALSVAAQCEWCIAFHVQNAAKLGATRGELVEAGFQAVVMHGGPAFMFMTRLIQAIDEYVTAEAEGASAGGSDKQGS